ncbi:MAG: glycerol-3-phosphate 1-O-acyltransferase PlsY [Pseudomonadota bacterium]
MPDLVTPPFMLVLWAFGAYLVGAIPFGMLLARALGLGDLRTIGSGNIGATNVLRTGNKLAAALTLVMDAAKGALPVLAARTLAGEDAAQIAAFAAFLGHCYPVWLGFRGGKGVATFLGVLLALAWPVGIASCLTWLVVAAIGRMSSMASISSALLSTVWMAVFGNFEMLVLGLALTAMILLRHAANIKRLKAGTEPKIGQK